MSDIELTEADDVADRLNAENRALRAEVERFKQAGAEWRSQALVAADDAATLRADNERLRAVLEVLTSNIEHAFPHLSHLGPVKNARAELAKEKQP